MLQSSSMENQPIPDPINCLLDLMPEEWASDPDVESRLRSYVEQYALEPDPNAYSGPHGEFYIVEDDGSLTYKGHWVRKNSDCGVAAETHLLPVCVSRGL